MVEILDKRRRAALFRERLTAALMSSGLSRAGLARAIAVDRSTVTQLLMADDARMPGGQVVAATAQALGVSSDWLLGLTDRPELAGDILATSLSVTETGRASAIDDQIFAWHEEAAGFKIRHVPATLPDMLKTHGVMRWEYAPTMNRRPDQAIGAAEARLDWMRSSQSDYEIALPIHELECFALGQGYYTGLSAALRREQIDWIIDVYDQLYPTLRLFIFDAHRVFSAPITVFGPKMAVIYMGRHYVAFRDRDRVQGVSQHFDWLIRESLASARQIPKILSALRNRIED
ncbi:transcriptional regulator [Roseobacter sp. HKCCD9010]|uniref:helix-turn-helix domain-containing protein n=1 Tax=unclassified Roseobacter TaxID=196798 RepID=UPI001490EBC7|nr:MULTISPECIES: helix-turn-helix transcriptional regulator [unclassified Roseobacter]MBF9051388.1 transcriptional regulator [Rhodobacterales bacterium HKCCD4356]NNV13435.1 transcriptional regulator [Roseobacter sp. HKCCD7357]NNV17686.1 transcriptional regulator [Roseobacter sp. HKCCD8768]NNV27292.1 transcriptional regulator [Roseobacter sp. HKCCD8192]NNV31412.1 transcriptional regulator [Roseobacter sp. HKCCD9061]